MRRLPAKQLGCGYGREKILFVGPGYYPAIRLIGGGYYPLEVGAEFLAAAGVF